MPSGTCSFLPLPFPFPLPAGLAGALAALAGAFAGAFAFAFGLDFASFLAASFLALGAMSGKKKKLVFFISYNVCILDSFFYVELGSGEKKMVFENNHFGREKSTSTLQETFKEDF